MRASLVLMSPGKAVHLTTHRVVHEPVIGRVKLHLIDAPAIAVKLAKQGLVAIGQLPQVHLFAAAHSTVRSQVPFAPTTAMVPNRRLKR
ncbi:hypothetical protein D3C81_1380430 [compost metagenome]